MRTRKLGDKICNLRDMAHNPPRTRPLERRQDYFDWAKAVVDGLRGVWPRAQHATALMAPAYRPNYLRLAGQSAEYTELQLKAFRSGERSMT